MTAISSPAIPGRRPPTVNTAPIAASPTLRLPRPTAAARSSTDPRAIAVAVAAAGNRRRRDKRARFKYTNVPIDALLATASPLDGGHAQSRADRRAGAMVLLLMAVTFVAVTLVVGLAVAHVIHIAVTDLTLSPNHISR